MEHHYRQFNLTLTTLAPIHIGNGEKYNSKDYIEIENGIYFPEMHKLYTFCVQNGIEDRYEKFLLEKSNFRNPVRLKSFLDKNLIRNRDFGGYSITGTDFLAKNGRVILNEISQFIKNPYNEPYIPGSSLKGAIRTILLNSADDFKGLHLKRKVNKYRFEENKNAIPWGPAKDTEKYDDIFNEIRVSDSSPFKIEDLIITQKWDYSPTTEKIKDLPLFRESLRPLAKAQFTITVTSDRAYRMIKHLGEYASEYYNEYEEFFLIENAPTKFIQNNVQYPLYIGSGSGVWTKTKIEESNGVVQQLNAKKRTKMKGKGVVKLTRASQVSYFIRNKDGNKIKKSLIKNKEGLYEMGKACFIVKEIQW